MRDSITILCLTFVLYAGNKEIPQEVDLIEHNTVVCDDGSESLRQIIIWEWSHEYRRYHVRTWAHVPEPLNLDHRQGRWHLWLPPYGRLVADHYRETRTRHDPERENLRVFPQEFRTPLEKK